MFEPRGSRPDVRILESRAELPAWYALYVRSRHESRVGAWLETRGLEVYVPLRSVWSSRRDRRHRIRVPALPGYLFFCCPMTPEIRALVKKAPGVVALVSTDGRPDRIPAEQIESLRILLESGRDVASSCGLATGKRVVIRSGPLRGASGILVRMNSARSRLVVQIEKVGLSLSVNLHEGDVELAA